MAVLGRFKAGKSSFLNHFLGRDILPVGAVPITTVITAIGYGLVARAVVHYVDGRFEQIGFSCVPLYVSESQNPENVKQVSQVSVQLPELERFRGLRFMDTPGLESALVHNTKASLDWLPNVGLALVAVSVDPPLSNQDITLLKALYEYTPNVSLLVTKIDLLSEADRREVLGFITEQLSKHLGKTPSLFPYSIRPGHEWLKADLETKLFQSTLADFRRQREGVLARKTDTLLRECEAFLGLALQAANVHVSEREALRTQVIGERQIVDEVKSEL
ncbi:MAG: dynamin family protein [Bryobacteraceae bacterium]